MTCLLFASDLASRGRRTGRGSRSLYWSLVCLSSLPIKDLPNVDRQGPEYLYGVLELPSRPVTIVVNSIDCSTRGSVVLFL